MTNGIKTALIILVLVGVQIITAATIVHINNVRNQRSIKDLVKKNQEQSKTEFKNNK